MQKQLRGKRAGAPSWAWLKRFEDLVTRRDRWPYKSPQELLSFVAVSMLRYLCKAKTLDVLMLMMVGSRGKLMDVDSVNCSNLRKYAQIVCWQVVLALYPLRKVKKQGLSFRNMPDHRNQPESGRNQSRVLKLKTNLENLGSNLQILGFQYVHIKLSVPEIIYIYIYAVTYIWDTFSNSFRLCMIITKDHPSQLSNKRLEHLGVLFRNQPTEPSIRALVRRTFEEWHRAWFYILWFLLYISLRWSFQYSCIFLPNF